MNRAYENLEVNRRGDSVMVLSLPVACAINELSLLTRQIFPRMQLQEAALLEATEGNRQAPAEIERKREETGASGGRRPQPGGSYSQFQCPQPVPGGEAGKVA